MGIITPAFFFSSLFLPRVLGERDQAKAFGGVYDTRHLL